MTTITPHRYTKKRLMKAVGAHTLCSCGYIQGGEYYFYIKDYQGNIRVVLNQSNQPIELNSYYSYGALMAATTTEGTQPYKYSAKELDRENGLDLYDSQARWYAPQIGRTSTLDPMAEKYPHLSPYLWCAANPNRYRDPDGRKVELYATSLPGCDIPLATHTFIVIRDKNNNVREYFAFEENDEEINLTTIAQKRNWILKGAQPDIERTAKIVLSNFREGKIGKFTLETIEEYKEIYNG